MKSKFYIEKLREMVMDNPESRLFLTLAEELKKMGGHDEAIQVLKEGLERMPSFTAARLTLGRWYLRDEMFEDARREFRYVKETTPEDQFADQYLREIDVQEAAALRRRKVDRLNKFLEALKRAFGTEQQEAAQQSR